MNRRYLNLLNSKKMTLIMSLPANDYHLAKIAWENGADVVKVHINIKHRASKTIFHSFDDEKENLVKILECAKGPTGIVLGSDVGLAVRDFNDVISAGFEFISLYAHHTPIEVLQSNKTIKMLAADYTYSKEEIKCLEKIGADVIEASIMHPETYGQSLSARDIISYRCICEETSIPIVVPTQHKVEASQLKVLTECGVNGIMIGAIVTGNKEETIAKTVSEFRNHIDKI